MFNKPRLEAQLDESGAEVLIASTQENVRYLTGIDSIALEMFPYTGAVAVVVHRDHLDAPAFVSSRCEVDQFMDSTAKTTHPIGHGAFFRASPAAVGARPASIVLSDAEKLLALAASGTAPETPDRAIRAALDAVGWSGGPLALEARGLPGETLSALVASLPNADRRDGEAVLRHTRKVKTPAEVALLRAAALLVEEAIAACIACVDAETSEAELVRIFETTIAAGGGRSRFTLIKFGRRGAHGQTKPSEVPIRSGEQIWFDVGCTLNGYWADIARTFVWDRAPSAKQRMLYDAMKYGADLAISKVRPGLTGGEVFEMVMEGVRRSGVPEYRRNHVGHGIGVEVYDPVLIRPGNDDIIEEGVVVNIETPYYEIGFGAVHIEDPFVVLADGTELLTASSREMIEIGSTA